MNRTVYKYPLATKFGDQIIEIPFMRNDDLFSELIYSNNVAKQIIHIAEQHDVMTIWALVDPDAPKRKVCISIRGTGDNCDGLTPEDHIGTVLVYDGDIVIHAFAREVFDASCATTPNAYLRQEAVCSA